MKRSTIGLGLCTAVAGIGTAYVASGAIIPQMGLVIVGTAITVFLAIGTFAEGIGSE